MSTRQTYTGDGTQTNFTFAFPYLSPTHVRVTVNEELRLLTMHYVLNGNTIEFVDAPGDGDAIVIQRLTSPSDPLVDFVDGSTLREADLDLAYLHNFYLSQEYADSVNKLINDALIAIATGNGITETEPDAVIAALVNEILNDSATAVIQQRVTDIDNNAEAILNLGSSLQIQINQLAQGIAADVFLQAAEPVPGVGGVPNPIPEGSRWYDSDDNNKPYIYTGGAWLSIEDPRVGQAVADISALQTSVGDNAAAIVNEASARSTADAATASTIALIGAENAGQTAFILDSNTVKLDSDAGDTVAQRFSALTAADGANASSIATNATAIAGVEARYGVDLNVNGYITGFRQNNDGETGNFVILADRFGVVTPTAAPGETPKVPFQIVGSSIRMTGDVQIDGSLMLNGTVLGSALVNGTIGATQIGSNAITSDKIGANAVTAGKVAANAITAGNINVTNLAAIDADMGAITAGSITLNSTGFIKTSGVTGFEDGAGVFIGYSGGNYVQHIGNPLSGNFLSWDGTTLTVKGDLFVGIYGLSDDILLEANTLRTVGGFSPFANIKQFAMDRPGRVRMTCEARVQSSVNIAAQIRAFTGFATFNTQDVTSTSWNTFTFDVPEYALDGLSEIISLQAKGGQKVIGQGEPNEPVTIEVRNCRIRGTVVIPADGGVILTN